MPLRYRVAIAFLLVPLLWGINWSFMKIGIQSMPPILLLGTRQLLAGLAHGGLALAWARPFPRGKAAVQAVLLGFLMAGFSNGLMFWGVQYISSGLGAILFGTMPFFVAFLSVPLLGERLTPAKLAGIAVGFGGVALLMGGDIQAGSGMALVGQAALLLSAVTWALPLVLLRKWLSAVDTLAMTAVQMLSGAVFLLPIGLVGEGLSRVHLTLEGVVAVAYMAIFSGFVGFALYYWLAGHLSPTRLALNSFITPGVAVVSGLILLAEPVTASLIVGLGLVALGIVIVNQWGDRPVAAAQPEIGNATGAIVYTRQSKPMYLLVKRTKAEGGMWTGVGGAAEPGETPLQTALREATEETGFNRFDRVVDLELTNRVLLNGDTFLLYAFGLQIGQQLVPVLDEEHEAYQWVDYETAMRSLHFENQRVALTRLHEIVSKSNSEG